QQVRDSILNSDKSYILIDASAGSGKTHQLVEKAFWYVENKFIKDYEQIALITFTQLATQQLRETIDKLIKKYSVVKEYINPKHTNNFKVLTNYGFVLEEIIRPF